MDGAKLHAALELAIEQMRAAAFELRQGCDTLTLANTLESEAEVAWKAMADATANP